MGEHLKISHKAQNLARIRDNQRRSRARRKEYLQELEARLRSCDQVGIEASTEIQSAARRVLDENKKLRALLLERGMTEADLVLALGGSTDRPFDQVSSAPVLSNALERRITSSRVSSTPLSKQPRDLSAPRTLPSAPSLSIPTSRPVALSSCGSLSPTSIVSSMGTPPATYQTPLYTTSMVSQAPEIKVDTDNNYSYEAPQNTFWSYHQGYPYSSDNVSHYGSSSCVDAANIIRTMRSDAGPIYNVDQLSQPYYSNDHMIYPVTTAYPQQYSSV